MALLLDRTRIGTVFSNSYHRVRNICIDKDTGIRFEVEIYTTKAKSDAEDREYLLSHKHYKLDWDDRNFNIADAYTYLLTLPEYTNATDDLEG